jgi:hypothetical protein
MTCRRPAAFLLALAAAPQAPEVPPWWITKPAEVRRHLEALPGVTVEEIGRTAGGRPILAAAWGEAEPRPGRTSTSLASAIAAGDPSAFTGKGERRRQTVLFVGAAHGTEFEGTVAAIHYLTVLATGKDLLGREHPRLAREGRAYRFVLVPFLNVDGRERALDHELWIGADVDAFEKITQGLKKDGTILRWPSSKALFPMPLGELEILGTYFNDAGVNLVYDTTFGGDCQPETTALLRLCRRELPDLVILSHSDHGSLVQPPSAYVPEPYKRKSDQIAAVVGARCAREGLPKSQIPRPRWHSGPEAFYQSDGIYHACGALPLVVEFPMGWQRVPATPREILDIGLTVLDEIAAFGNRYGFRPPDPPKK